MKKLFLLTLFLSFNISSIFAQKFKPSVEVIEFMKSDNYVAPKSILIEFTGHTHSIYFYSDLAKKLKRRFKRKSIKVRFNYNLSSKKPWKHDLDITPKEKYLIKDFDAFCEINYPIFKSWDILKGEYGKQNLKLNVRLLKEDEIILKSILDVYTYKTILTQNKKVSKTIVMLITESN